MIDFSEMKPLLLGPWQTAVLTLKKSIPLEDLIRLRETWKKTMGNTKLLILDGGIELTAITIAPSFDPNAGCFRKEVWG